MGPMRMNFSLVLTDDGPAKADHVCMNTSLTYQQLTSSIGTSAKPDVIQVATLGSFFRILKPERSRQNGLAVANLNCNIRRAGAPIHLPLLDWLMFPGVFEEASRP